MLNLILGRNISNKTEYVRTLVADKIKAGGSGYIIIVPEQFSYETERSMLSKVGPDGMLSVDVLSLSRLAELILEECGKTSQKMPVDDGIRMMTMNLALEALSGELTVFKKHITRPVLTANLVSFATELKQCSVTVDMISEYVKTAEKSSLKSKLEELVLIISLYNAMLDKEYYNTDDAFDLLYDALAEYKFFEGRTVVIDEFTRFTKQELKVIERVIAQSEDVYITFNTDPKSFGDDYSMFSNINKQVEVIKNLANKCNAQIANPIVIEAADGEIDENLLKLEKNIFNIEKEIFADTENDSVTVLSAPNKADECAYIAQTIKRLMREDSARCKDIIVFERSKDSYDRELAAAFKKYGVPFYEDKRQPIDTQPLVVFLRCLFEIAVNGISTESLMRYLKTGLTDLTVDEISRLENYAFVWNVKASQWVNDFTENPRGFGTEFTEADTENLNELNELRRKAVGPILAFKKDFLQAVGEEKTKVLYDFIVKQNIRFKIRDIAKCLYEQGNQALCEEQEAIWSLVMQMLDKLYLATQNGTVTVKRYFELFDILLSVSDLGSLPKGLDAVTVGAADRTRTELKKYVFVVGANDGVFPLCPSTQGLLNDKDRAVLKNAGIELAETAEYKQIEEQYTAYRALTSAKKKLFITYSEADYNGTSKQPSSIVDEVQTIFPNVKTKHYAQLDIYDRIESVYSAFEVLADNYNVNNSAKSTLEKYFSDNEVFKGRINSLKTAVTKEPIRIENAKIAVDLFGKDLYMSASRTEVYQECPFKYFCKYGIKAEPIKEAKVDPAISGTVIHEVFELMLQKYSKTELINMSDDELRALIDTILKNYLNEKLGGEANRTNRFIKQYSAIGEQSFGILKRIIEELKTCDFIPTDFELPINDEKIDEGIPSYEVKIDNDSILKIFGSVDRVDVMEKDGKKYLRVVDYKSGGKSFKISDVLSGLSTQMLIYLFAIDANGKERYGEVIPSGVLYMSAKIANSNLSRNASEDEINKVKMNSNRMSGIVLNDMTAIEGMDSEISGKFIPVELNKGVIKGDLVSSDDFKLLKKKIDKILREIGNDLHSGRVEVLPCGNRACTYCDYSSICRFEIGDKVREIPEFNNGDALKVLQEGEVDEDAENEME